MISVYNALYSSNLANGKKGAHEMCKRPKDHSLAGTELSS
jgi:hypothetical protein